MNCLLLLFIVSFANIIQCDIYTNTTDETFENDINALISGGQIQVQDTVRLDLYYESLCPYSIKLYQQQLAPLMQKLMDYIELYTYPFGHAEVIKIDGKTTFECQHGPRECYGNGLHACAIHYFPKPSEYIPFIACLMRRQSTDKAAELCGQRLHFDFEPITTCAKGAEAVNLLVYYAQETAKVNVTQVPFTVINGKVMDPDNPLLDSVCAAFNEPPKECQKNNLNL